MKILKYFLKNTSKHLSHHKLGYLALALSSVLLCGCREVEHSLIVDELTVVDRNERKGGGDDVMLGAIYFTSNFGVANSTDVRLLPVRKLADNVDNGESVGRGRTQVFDFDWATFQAAGAAEKKSYSQNADDLWSAEDGFSFEGAIFIAVEEDNVGDRRLRNTVNDATVRVLEALRGFVEHEDYRGTADDVGARLEYISNSLNCFEQYVSEDIDCDIPGDEGIGDSGTNIGHDPIGTATILFVGSENRLLLTGIRNAAMADRWNGANVFTSASNCGGTLPADVHVCEFIDGLDRPVNNTINLLFRGEDAVWTLALTNTTQIIE